jgi:hypothetical protein
MEDLNSIKKRNQSQQLIYHPDKVLEIITSIKI